MNIPTGFVAQPSAAAPTAEPLTNLSAATSFAAALVASAQTSPTAGAQNVGASALLPEEKCEASAQKDEAESDAAAPVLSLVKQVLSAPVPATLSPSLPADPEPAADAQSADGTPAEPSAITTTTAPIVTLVPVVADQDQAQDPTSEHALPQVPPDTLEAGGSLKQASVSTLVSPVSPQAQASVTAQPAPTRGAVAEDSGVPFLPLTQAETTAPTTTTAAANAATLPVPTNAKQVPSDPAAPSVSVSVSAGTQPLSQTPATAVAPAQAPLPSAPTPQPLAEQLARPILTVANSGNGTHTVTVQIAPHNLGPVTVNAHVSGSDIHIELFAPTDGGRDALKLIMADLRRDMAGQGLAAQLNLADHDRPDAQTDQHEKHHAEPIHRIESAPIANATALEPPRPIRAGSSALDVFA